MSAGLHIDLSELARLNGKLAAFAAIDRHALLDVVGAEVETQTRRRIAEEKTSPAGTPWPAWSSDYAATRSGGQSLLQSSGHLLDSITHNVTGVGDAVEVGSDLIYAATHEFGDERRGIPQREFLGLSDENTADILSVVNGWLAQHARRTLQ